MALASEIQSLMPTIKMYRPTVDATTSPVTFAPQGVYLGELTQAVSAYHHTIMAFGGFWAARFSINEDTTSVDEWLDDGVGRHIDVYDNALLPMFQGFVNKVTAVIGPVTIVVGPLMDVGNRVRVIYSTVDTSVSPPMMGIRAGTSLQNDSESIAKFGRLVTFLSTGGSTETNALEVRDRWLAENAWPKTTQSFNLGATAIPRISVEVLGYVHLFNKQYYSNESGSGQVNASTKIENVIDGQDTTFFNTDHKGISTNTMQVDDYAEVGGKAIDTIKAIVAQGDTSDNRWLFGVYEDFVPWYNVAPSTIEYRQRMTDSGQQFFDSTTSLVFPWNIRPGKWLFFDDLLVGRVDESTDLERDPRAMFIESVQYTSPWSLSLQGGKTDTLSQKIARMGLGGVGG